MDRAKLRASIRLVLTDTDLWPDATLNVWIDDAINDYSKSFSLRDESTVQTAEGQARVQLSTSTKPILEIVSIWYSAKDIQLKYMDMRDPRFAGGGYYYDWRYVLYQTSADIYFGFTPEATGIPVKVQYETVHVKPISDISLITVPDNHVAALHAFVVWKAIQMLEVDDVIRAAGLVAEVTPIAGMTAARAEAVYRRTIAELKKGQGPGGYVPAWSGEEDRVY
jgi:hypothetical protein